jgi:hypothetical protein
MKRLVNPMLYKINGSWFSSWHDLSEADSLSYFPDVSISKRLAKASNQSAVERPPSPEQRVTRRP